MDSSSPCNTRGFTFIPTDSLAVLFGADEPGLRLIVATLLGYPLTLPYHLVFSKQTPAVKHIYIIFCGLLLGYFCYGVNIVHSIITTLVSWLSLKSLGGSSASVLFAFIFNCAYLFTGYYICEDESYCISYGTSQCVICLKAIGVAWDLYDGRKEKEKPSARKSSSSLSCSPSLLEVFGHIYFYSAFITGPLFSLKTYKDFVEDRLIDEEADRKGPSRSWVALKRFIMGMFLLFLTVLFQKSYPLLYPVSKSFMESSLPEQAIHVVLWVLGFFIKYFAIWYLADSCTTFIGLSFSGKTKDGDAEWNGTRNVDFFLFLTGDDGKSMLDSFNICVNRWISKHIFKRIYWMFGVAPSAILTGVFVGLWHGLYIGLPCAFILQAVFNMIFIMFADLLHGLTGYAYRDLPLLPRTLTYLARVIYRWCSIVVFMSCMALKTRERLITIFTTKFYICASIAILLPGIAAIFLRPLFGRDRNKIHKNNNEDSSNSKKIE